MSSRSKFLSAFGVRPGSKLWIKPRTGLRESAASSALCVMNLAMVSGTTRFSWALARRSTSMLRLSFFEASPSSAVWQDVPKMLLVDVPEKPLFKVRFA